MEDYPDYTANMQKAQLEQGVGQLIRPTRRKQLQTQRTLLVRQLEIVDKALAALDAHPDLEEFAEALSRAGV